MGTGGRHAIKGTRPLAPAVPRSKLSLLEPVVPAVTLDCSPTAPLRGSGCAREDAGAPLPGPK
jgi:hypothetical protein